MRLQDADSWDRTSGPFRIKLDSYPFEHHHPWWTYVQDSKCFSRFDLGHGLIHESTFSATNHCFRELEYAVQPPRYLFCRCLLCHVTVELGRPVSVIADAIFVSPHYLQLSDAGAFMSLWSRQHAQVLEV